MAEDPLKSSSVRSFLAIPLGDIFYKELDHILELLCGNIPGVRWAKPGQLHLTLHFFGSIPISEIGRIDSSMKKVASSFGSFELSVDQLGGFPDLKKPNILWLGIKERTGRLLSLQSAVQEEVRALGFPVETRPFHPHVTVARIKKKIKGLELLCEKIPFKFPTIEKTADHFVLYQSRCLPEGACYDVLKTYSFPKKT